MVEEQIASLISSGIVPEDRVGVHASSNLESIVSLFALTRIGAVAVLLNLRWPQQELESVMRQLSVVATIGESNKDSGYACRVSRTTLGGSRNADLHEDKYNKKFDNDERGVVFFTSGTSATPKAALLSVENLIYNALGANERMPLDGHSRWLLSLPLYHVGGAGILYRSFLAGSAVVIPEHAETLSSSLARYAPTHLSVVHTQLWRLLHDESLQIAKWPICLLGGGPTTSELIRIAVTKGVTLQLSYGLTEMASQVTTSEVIASASDPTLAGKPLPYRKVQISPSGEILTAGETLFTGYITSERLDPSRDDEGWFHTGDLGAWSDNGALRILGRRDHQFISGGENVHPESIEAVLMSVPGIELAVVVPVDDPEFGRRPVAFIAPDSNHTLTREIVDHAKRMLEESIPRYMHPVEWYQMPGSWQSTAIKPRRRELQEMLQKGEALIPPVP
jgi:o-succinylbenzoate---CoA ligase